MLHSRWSAISLSLIHANSIILFFIFRISRAAVSSRILYMFWTVSFNGRLTEWAGPVYYRKSSIWVPEAEPRNTGWYIVGSYIRRAITQLAEDRTAQFARQHNALLGSYIQRAPHQTAASGWFITRIVHIESYILWWFHLWS